MTARKAVQGLPAKEYAARRRAVLDAVAPQSALLLPAGRELLRNGDTHYPFRQSSDFLYLTGFQEADAILVLLPGRREVSPKLRQNPRRFFTRQQPEAQRAVE